MASLLSPRRVVPEIALRATVAQDEQSPRPDEEPALPGKTWLATAAGGALLAVLCGWVLVTGFTVLAWLAGDTGSFAGAMLVGTQLWLLANGAGATIGSSTLTLVPLGATIGFAYLLSRLAAFAARQASGPRLGCAASITAVTTVAYAGPVLVVALLTNGLPLALPGTPAVLVVMGLAAWRGSCRGLGYHPTHSWPQWCRALPRAVLAGQLTLIVAGAAALIAGLLVHLNRVLALTDALQPGLLGGIALWLVQLAYVPNAIVWAASYTLGAGFSLGSGSVVALSATEHGLLPSVPLLGALPAAGSGQPTSLWWLAAGVLAGGVAAWVMMRARPAARFDETSLVGGLSGLLCGLAFVVVAWATGGDLGSARLAGLGPRLLPLLVLSVATMGLAGMLVGLVLGLLRRPAR